MAEGDIPVEQRLIPHPRHLPFWTQGQDDPSDFRTWWRHQQQPHPHYRVNLPDSSGTDPRAWRPPLIRQRGRDPQVTTAQPLVPKHALVAPNVEQGTRLLNVGPKPVKWAGDTPLSAFKTDLILHYRATELPRQKWGIASLAFLDNAYRTTFLSRLATERGLQADPELIAQAQIT